METLLDRLNKELLKDKYYLDESGEIILEKVKTSALNLDDHLMSILLKNEEFKNVFFVKKSGVLVFDKVKFSWIISNSNFLPDSYTSYKNKIGLVDNNNDFLVRSDDVTLSFPYKDCLLEFDSTKDDEERNEIFLNELLASDYIDVLLSPKALVNATKVTKQKEEAVKKYNNENLVIKGNNLIGLHCLEHCMPSSIKMMYWDILYNTQSDMVPYNDKFKHSSWLVMMKNRLEVAKKLLKPDGVICLQCDDNEQPYLRVLCDEIFDRENFVNNLVIEMASTGGLKRTHKDKRFLKTKEYILIYKNDGELKINPVYDKLDLLDDHFSLFFDYKVFEPLSHTIAKKFPEKSKYLDKKYWLLDKEIKKFILSNSEYIWQTDGHGVSKWVNEEEGVKRTSILKLKDVEIFKAVSSDGKKIEIMKSSNGKTNSLSKMQPLSWKIEKLLGVPEICNLRGDLWKDFYKDMGNVKNEGDVALKNGKKPERLLRDLIQAFTNKNDIVLDAYFGTGTTGAVAMKMNRRFIGLEQLTEHFEKSITRLKNVISGDDTIVSEEQDWKGGGEFIYCQLANYNQAVIESIAEAKENELNKIYHWMLDSPYVLNYNLDLEILSNAKNVDAFDKLSIVDKKKSLITMLDKNILYVSLSDIDDEDCKLSNLDKSFSKSFYNKN